MVKLITSGANTAPDTGWLRVQLPTFSPEALGFVCNDPHTEVEFDLTAFAERYAAEFGRNVYNLGLVSAYAEYDGIRDIRVYAYAKEDALRDMVYYFMTGSSFHENLRDVSNRLGANAAWGSPDLSAVAPEDWGVFLQAVMVFYDLASYDGLNADYVIEKVQGRYYSEPAGTQST